MKFFIRRENNAPSNLSIKRLFRSSFPELIADIIRWLTRPDGKNVISSFGKHGGPTRAEVAKRLGVRSQATWTDAESKSSLEQIVDHRHLGCYLGRVIVWQVDRTTAKFDPCGVMHQAGA